MNNLFHELNKYEGWEKYWDQIRIVGYADATHSFIHCKIFYDKTSFFGRKKKVSVDFELAIHTYDRVYTQKIIINYASKAGAIGAKWGADIDKWVEGGDLNGKESMIELAEMALVTSDPYVKDAFITKWLAKVKPIK